jgi:hypothetical protein
MRVIDVRVHDVESLAGAFDEGDDVRIVVPISEEMTREELAEYFETSVPSFFREAVV